MWKFKNRFFATLSVMLLLMAVLGTGVVAAEESTDSGSKDGGSADDSSSSDNSVDDSSSDNSDSADDSSDSVDDSSDSSSDNSDSVSDSSSDDSSDNSVDDSTSDDSADEPSSDDTGADDSVSDSGAITVEEDSNEADDDSNSADDGSTAVEVTNEESNDVDGGSTIIEYDGPVIYEEENINSTSTYSDDDNITKTTTIVNSTIDNSHDSNTTITETEIKDIDIDNSKNTNIYFEDNSVVNNINFASKESGKTKVIVKEVHDKPPVENVYKTFNIWIDNKDVASNVENAAVDFKVEKTWLIENNLDSSTIILNMHEGGKWIEVPVTVTGEDSKYVYFAAKVSKYSTFAITSNTVAVDKVLKQKNTDEDNDSVEDMDEPTKNVVVKLLELVIDLIEGN